jgi:hypothetical protein
MGKPIMSSVSLPPGISSAPTPIRTPPSVLLTVVSVVGHFRMNRRFMSLAETRLPPNMQTAIAAPTTGIETIDPTDAVIKNPGAKTARIVKVIPIAPIASVSVSMRNRPRMYVAAISDLAPSSETLRKFFGAIS